MSCGAGPVVAAGEQFFAVEQCELVMHMVRRAINPHRNAGFCQTFDVGAGVKRLFIVGDDPHRNTPEMPCENLRTDPVIRNREHADVGLITRRFQQTADAAAAIVTRTETGFGFPGRQRFVIPPEHFGDFFQPLQHALRVDRINRLTGQFKSDMVTPVPQRLTQRQLFQPLPQCPPFAAGQAKVVERLFQTVFKFVGLHGGDSFYCC